MDIVDNLMLLNAHPWRRAHSSLYHAGFPSLRVFFVCKAWYASYPLYWKALVDAINQTRATQTPSIVKEITESK